MGLFKKDTKKELADQKEIRPEEKKNQAKPAGKTTVEKDLGRALGILIKPLVTEKSSFLGQYGQYVFEVSPRANKIEVAKAIWHAYGVKPESVNLIKVRGREVHYGKTRGVTRKKKKAIITLKQGDKIEIHEGV